MENQAKKILKVLIYIENHIHEEIKIETLAALACYSVFHFQRLFSSIVGESIHQYIRRLRLEAAATKLQFAGVSISKVALDANFKTLPAFTKVFKKCLGKSPKNYRQHYEEVNVIAKKMNELPMIQPDEIKEISDISVLFIRRIGGYETASKNAWDAILAILKENNLETEGAHKLGFFSMAHDDPNVTAEKKIRFDACVRENPRLQLHKKLEHRVIPGGKYAIFTQHGERNSLKDTYDRIFYKWFPESKENYDEKRQCFMQHIDWATMKIYVPLV